MFGQILPKLGGTDSKSRRRAVAGARRHLRFEGLEDRRLLSVILAGGEGEDGACDVGGLGSGGSCDSAGSSADAISPEVTSVEVTHLVTSRIRISFSEAVNADSLIGDGSIVDAVHLSETGAGPIVLQPEQFSYADAVLSIDFDSQLAGGSYHLELDGNLLRDLADNAMAGNAQVQPAFEPAELLTAGGSGIQVDSYSTPTLFDWNGDGSLDLIVGEKTDAGDGKVRVYLNAGSDASPQYSDFFYAQTDGGDLTVGASGCLGVFPRLADWDGDGRPDLILGLADGTVQVALNENTGAEPQFATPFFVQVGEPGAKTNLNVGARATVAVVDWNNDQRSDLVVGGLDGRVRLLLNEAASGTPDFRQVIMLQDGAEDLHVPSDRSSVAVVDADGDGKKDLISGNTEGQILLYANTGTDASPQFDGYVYLEAGQTMIDLDGIPRSRPDVVDADGDGLLDLLVGSQDGRVRFYQGVQPAGDNGTYTHSFDVPSDLPPAWQCPADPLDVNNDGWITPRDVLIVLNYINEQGSGAVPAGVWPTFYYDCTGDDFISPRDVLLVINAINANGIYEASGACTIGEPTCEGEGEGESSQPPLQTFLAEPSPERYEPEPWTTTGRLVQFSV